MLALYQKGWPQKQIAEALGITKGYVSQLVKKVKDLPEAEQEGALKIVVRSGRKPHFTPQQKRQICALVDKGAESFGLPGAAWTLKSLRVVIHKELGFWVGKSWLAQMLAEAGYSCQKPQKVAKEKNKAKVSGFVGGWHNFKRGQSETPPP